MLADCFASDPFGEHLQVLPALPGFGDGYLYLQRKDALDIAQRIAQGQDGWA